MLVCEVIYIKRGKYGNLKISDLKRNSTKSRVLATLVSLIKEKPQIRSYTLEGRITRSFWTEF